MTKKRTKAELTPRVIVQELNRYIIGQDKAKKAVAIAIRNRYRRSLLPEEIRDEITPKNIILMGPTGVGKTEIARRLAKLVSAPFIKVEATKFTEVGYVGRDVESMVRDLVTTSIRMVKQQKMDEVREKAEARANEMILDILVPQHKKQKKEEKLVNPFELLSGNGQINQPADDSSASDEQASAEIVTRREDLRKDLLAGKLEDERIEVELDDDATKSIGVMAGMSEDMSIEIGNIFDGLMPGGKKKKKRTMKISEARKAFANQEAQKMIDMDEVNETGIREAEQNGIIFIDEIDKIIDNGASRGGPDVSREGVQRDILPIVEGSTVNTKYGPVKTDFMLFIGAGAFNVANVEDMIPELQGRFPVSVHLDSLTEEDFVKILTQPENAIVKQYTYLMRTEGIEMKFEEEALKEVAAIAFQQNEEDENIGARRLHTVFEELLEEISFYASDYDEDTFTVTKAYVDSVFKPKDNEKSYEKYLI
ncbi:MAG: ATP-dependent protease ATPase subunit HslU [Eubacteriaceae bacterium]|uniref:ATP-dependent protease ATPase subunit HslU n=1 Tax=Candidatus Pseudoramibacter fermentans TaxID=2594427 RepID=A0A6L5GS43_9FIRM|nr:ATP-dependent protease ATPase subunit HslU [Candidatus Pseudoramibacter fermentans]RRF92092.1 MAG: ATP-dependent protease ATPase subunit HslU [Eubacteriaceae bacterium]